MCCSPYNQVFENDLTVNYADRVEIIEDDGEHFLFVKNILTKKTGYVPRMCLKSLSEFLNYF